MPNYTCLILPKRKISASPFADFFCVKIMMRCTESEPRDAGGRDHLFRLPESRNLEATPDVQIFQNLPHLPCAI